MQPGCEADDLLASSATKVAARGSHVVILSTDTSLCQMLGPRVEVYDHFSGRYLDEAFVRRLYERLERDGRFPEIVAPIT